MAKTLPKIYNGYCFISQSMSPHESLCTCLFCNLTVLLTAPTLWLVQRQPVFFFFFFQVTTHCEKGPRMQEKYNASIMPPHTMIKAKDTIKRRTCKGAEEACRQDAARPDTHYTLQSSYRQWQTGRDDRDVGRISSNIRKRCAVACLTPIG